MVLPDQPLTISETTQIVSVAEEIQHVIEEAEGVVEAEEEEEDEGETIEQAVENMEATEVTEQVLEIVQEEVPSETERICSVVHHDALIQQFGLNLVNMSTQPNSRATVVTQLYAIFFTFSTPFKKLKYPTKIKRLNYHYKV